MSRFSLLRYPCLFVLSVVGSWVLLALLFLFFPALPYDWDLEPPNRVLESPNALTRVYRFNDWFPYHEDNVDVQALRDEADRELFAVEYHTDFNPATYKTRSSFNIGGVVLDLHAYWQRIDQTHLSSTDTPASYVSEQIRVPAKFGDVDGMNPPWFWPADSCLLFWDIHQETSMIPLRLRVENHRASQIVEVWPDSSTWDRSVDNATPWATGPLVTIYSDDQFRKSLDVRFPSIGGFSHTSPSRTLPIRRGIQSIIVPTGLFVYNHSGFVAIGLVVIFETISLVIKVIALYAMVVLACWIANGKPSFGPWARSYWLTRLVAAKLPNLNRDSEVWEQETLSDGDSVGSKRRPQPLRGFADFFRSRSPLDDLFVTFEFTKSMVAPITFQRNRADSADGVQVTGVPNNIKFNVSHRSTKQGQTHQQMPHSDLEKGELSED